MKRRTWIRAGIIAVCAVLLLAGGILAMRLLDRNGEEKRGQMTSGFGQLKTVEWNGQKYREKPAVTTILIGGVDKTLDEETMQGGNYTYRAGGRADFLVLLAIDHTDKTIHQMQIDRDTMAEVVTLGIFGNETGTRVLQICLAHIYGATPQDSAKYTVRAVENLLGGMQVDGYYFVNYNAIPVLNDLVGGVTVTANTDMTSIHPEWTEGAKITLHGKEAEQFVRARMGVGSGTNRERMVRQNDFMRNAISQMNKKISADIGFADTLLTRLQDIAVTNMTKKRLTEELTEAYNYSTGDPFHPDGEYGKDEYGYVTFQMREDAAVEWVLEHLYTKE